jgi:hypothetical protein
MRQKQVVGPVAEGGLERLNLSALKLDPLEPLEAITRRSPCPGCGSSRLHYCYDCVVSVGDYTPPNVELPFDIHVVRAPAEKRSKSSAVPLGVLSKQVKISDLPPTEGEGAVLLFPCPEAVAVGEVDWAKVNKVVVIDCTWFQVPAMLRLPELAVLPRVRISSLATNFWRHQHVGPECLATAEAMYQVCRERAGEGYGGQYDNLLWYFTHQYKLLQARCRRAGGTMVKNTQFTEGDCTTASKV